MSLSTRCTQSLILAGGLLAWSGCGSSSSTPDAKPATGGSQAVPAASSGNNSTPATPATSPPEDDDDRDFTRLGK